MFFPEGQIRVHLYGYPCDMRKSFDGLYALTRQGLQANPLSGDLYVFISRRATIMKVLYFDRWGFCVWAKKLEAGRFVSDWAQVHTHETPRQWKLRFAANPLRSALQTLVA